MSSFPPNRPRGFQKLVTNVSLKPLDLSLIFIEINVFGSEDN